MIGDDTLQTIYCQGRSPCLGLLIGLATMLVLLTGTAQAAVTGIDIDQRFVVAAGKHFGDTGPYELVKGRLRFAVTPGAAANERIVDLHLAPTDGRGRVTFTAECLLVKPGFPERGNGRLLYGVNNRGNVIQLHTFNDADWKNRPVSAKDFGNGFLLEQGYTLLWSGWNWDVLPGNNKLQIVLPIATENGRAITGTVAAEMAADVAAPVLPVAWGGSRGYVPANIANPKDRLTVRRHPTDRRQHIPRNQWRFVVDDAGRVSLPVRIALVDGFRPGLLYELVYDARDPRVAGLGLAAIRDTLSFFRYQPADDFGNLNPVTVVKSDGVEPAVDAVIVYGFSQSGRVIQHMLLEGLHLDEAGRPAFDAAFVHGPGAGKGSFNHRFAQTTRHPSHYEDHLYPADFFPFATVATEDPVSDRRGDLLERARRSGVVPKIFYLAASTEYWTRSASLLHTSVDGRRDVGHDRHVRIYAVAGAQHSVSVHTGLFGYRNCHNPLDFRPLARALLVALDDWATKDIPPPASVHSRLADGTLGTVDAYRRMFPEIAGLSLPDGNLQPPRLDHGDRFETSGIADRQPAVPGPPYKTLVPLPDQDGIDRGGVRMPEAAAPLGSYLGWNLRNGSGRDRRLGRWQGSFVPFRATRDDRLAAGDPRHSIGERYSSRKSYLDAISAAAEPLVRRRLLLRNDVPAIVERAGRAYSELIGGGRRTSCRFLGAWRPIGN